MSGKLEILFKSSECIHYLSRATPVFAIAFNINEYTKTPFDLGRVIDILRLYIYTLAW